MICSNGHTNQGQALSPPVKIGVDANAEQAGQPKIITDSGVKRGKLTEGGSWKFSFLPIDPANPVVNQNGTIQVQVDGYTVSADLTAGWTAIDAAFALYSAMQAAGFEDVTLVGDSEIEFLNNNEDLEAIEVAVNFIAEEEPGTASGGIFVQVGIADRTIFNQAPVAVDDGNYSVLVNQTLSVEALGVLANDYDPDLEPITVVAVNGSPGNIGVPITLASGATLTVNADGSFTYTAAADFVGVDSFTYTISDGIDEATATVFIDVLADT